MAERPHASGALSQVLVDIHRHRSLGGRGRGRRQWWWQRDRHNRRHVLRANGDRLHAVERQEPNFRVLRPCRRGIARGSASAPTRRVASSGQRQLPWCR
eukprot:1206589-Prymnesium_polylepis.1